MSIALKNLQEQKKTKMMQSNALANHENNKNHVENMEESHERTFNLIKRVFGTAKKSNTNAVEGAININNDTQVPEKQNPPKAKHSVFQKSLPPDEENNLQDEFDDDDKDSYEDEDSQKYNILKSHKLFLYFSSKQEFLAQEFYDQAHKRTSGHMKTMLMAFIVVYLFQTLIIISVRLFIRSYLVILLIKGCIALIMIVFLFLIKSFYKSNLMKFLLFAVSLAALVMSVVQGYNSTVKELNTVQSIELVLLFAFTSYFP